MTRIKGQSEAARNARLDRACCPIHGLFMSQVAGWWYPLDGEPFTLVECGRSDCDVICKSYGFEGPVSDPLTPAEIKAITGEHSFRWEIEYSVHTIQTLVLTDARKQRDTGALSPQDYDLLAANVEQIKTLARTSLAMLDGGPKERER